MGDDTGEFGDYLVDRKASHLNQSRSQRLGVIGRRRRDKNSVVQPPELHGKLPESAALRGRVVQVDPGVRVARHGNQARQPHIEFGIGQSRYLRLQRAYRLLIDRRIELKIEVRMQLRNLVRDVVEIQLPCRGRKLLAANRRHE